MTSTTMSRLRTLDPADRTPDPALRARLDTRVLAIPASLPGIEDLTGTREAVGGFPRPVRPLRPRRTRRRVVFLAVAVATATAAAVVLPGPRGDEAAYASWTATPTTVADRDLAVVTDACRDQLGGGWLPWADTPFDAETARVVVAERRGAYVALLLRPTTGADLSGFCLATNPPGTGEVSDVDSGLAGSDGPAAVAGPREFLEGSMAQFGGGGGAFVDGVAGADVLGVRIHDAGGRSVDATVANGRYVAWWPGSVFGPDTDAGRAPEPLLRYDVTLRDGTVLHDVAPSRPQWPQG